MKMFSEHPFSINWSKKNNEKPEEVQYCSKKNYLFDCPECGHEFQRTLHEITIGKKKCRYCTKRIREVCGDKECKMCFDKSFASLGRSKDWSKKKCIETLANH